MVLILCLGAGLIAGCSTWQQDKPVVQQDLVEIQSLLQLALKEENLEKVEAVRAQVEDLVSKIPAEATKDEQVHHIGNYLIPLVPEPYGGYIAVGLGVLAYLQRRKLAQATAKPPASVDSV